jgi:hypothetical protein
MAAPKPSGCQRNAVQNMSVRHILALAPPLLCIEASRSAGQTLNRWSLSSSAVGTRTPSTCSSTHALDEFKNLSPPLLTQALFYISAYIVYYRFEHSSFPPSLLPISGLRYSPLSWYTISGHCHTEVWNPISEAFRDTSVDHNSNPSPYNATGGINTYILPTSNPHTHRLFTHYITSTSLPTRWRHALSKI